MAEAHSWQHNTAWHSRALVWSDTSSWKARKLFCMLCSYAFLLCCEILILKADKLFRLQGISENGPWCSTNQANIKEKKILSSSSLLLLPVLTLIGLHRLNSECAWGGLFYWFSRPTYSARTLKDFPSIKHYTMYWEERVRTRRFGEKWIISLKVTLQLGILGI